MANEFPTFSTLASVPKSVLVPVTEESHRPLADHPIDHAGQVEAGIKLAFDTAPVLTLEL